MYVREECMCVKEYSGNRRKAVPLIGLETRAGSRSVMWCLSAWKGEKKSEYLGFYKNVLLSPETVISLSSSLDF